MDTRERAAHHHPIRRLLNQAVGMRRVPDEQQLQTLNAPPHVIDAVRDAAADLVEAANAGGFRSVHKARQAGELIARELAERTPATYADALPRGDSDTDFDGSAAAEAVQTCSTVAPLASNFWPSASLRMICSGVCRRLVTAVLLPATIDGPVRPHNSWTTTRGSPHGVNRQQDR
jgi:hypothetical protein